MSVHPDRDRRRAFTLIELLVVIAVIGVLAAILIPVVAKVRASAQSTHCVSNMQQLGRAFTLYAQDNRSLLPAPVGPAPDLTPWYVAIHPYTGTAWTPPSGGSPLQLAPVFSCPTWANNDNNIPEVGDIGYAMSAALGMTVDSSRPVPISSLQSPTRSLLVLELTGTAMPYFPNGGSLPDFATTYLGQFEAESCDRHEGAANYLFADGHVGHHTPSEAQSFLP